MNRGGVVIVGGGLAAHRCARTLRKEGYDGSIRIVCEERQVPYDRPPLSKAMLSGPAPGVDLALSPADWYPENEVDLLLGRRAVGLDPKTRRIRLDDETVLPYAKLLVANGAAANELPALAGFSNVQPLRTLEDARKIEAAIGGGGHVVLVGSGFIGQEVAAAARARGNEVTIIEAMPSPLEHILGADTGRLFADFHSARGIRLLTGRLVESARGNGRVEELVLSDGGTVACDTVVVGIGVRPATGWLEGSGLELDGVLTDPGARTRVEHVYAAGDVTRSFDPYTGRHSRSEHWDAAVRQGKAAAMSMLGKEAPGAQLPSFWSDQYGSRIQYVGHAELADRTELAEGPDEGSFSAHFFRRDRLVAALAVDQPRLIASAMRTIRESHTNNPDSKGSRDELQSVG
jgi:NADPH-dependent 2,4-dienoyl-CoA reductase/sulfur reductase-like enzyme